VAAAVKGSPRRLLRRAARAGAGSMWASDDPLPSLLLASRAVTGRLRGRRARVGVEDEHPEAA